MLMKKLTSNKGNTLTVTIVIIVVMSILAASAAMMITLSTRVQIRNEKNLKEKIALENSMYEVLMIDDLKSYNGEYYLVDSKLESIESIGNSVSTYKSIVSIKPIENGKTITVEVAITLDYNNALFFTLEIESGKITRWGTGKWNQ